MIDQNYECSVQNYECSVQNYESSVQNYECSVQNYEWPVQNHECSVQIMNFLFKKIMRRVQVISYKNIIIVISNPRLVISICYR